VLVCPNLFRPLGLLAIGISGFIVFAGMGESEKKPFYEYQNY
jgi:hypothetical protein